MLLTLTSLVLDSGVIPPGSGAFAYFTAAQNGFTSAVCTSLLVNGFVGFQLYEDGTKQSVWLLRGSSIGMFILSGGISLMTFKSWGLAPTNTLGLFAVLYLINALFLFVYVVSQVLLVTRTLQDRWPLGHIGFGVFFFVAGQVILYVFGNTICNAAHHYLDGLFFATICNLLAVMMVYKVNRFFGESSDPLLTSPSIGTRSRKRTWSSVLAPSKAIGRSRSHYPKKTVEARHTKTVLRHMRAACMTRLLQGLLTMAATINGVDDARLCTLRPIFQRSIARSVAYLGSMVECAAFACKRRWC